jgi:transposase-like protein
MSEQEQNGQRTRLMPDLSEQERLEIAELIRTGQKTYREILRKYNIKNLSTITGIKTKYVDGNGATIPRERKPMKESTKNKIRKSALAVAQVMQHEVVVGRELSMLDGILYNMDHLLKIIDFHDIKTTEAIEKVREIHELLLKKHKSESVAEAKRKVYVLGAVEDMINRLTTFIQAHNTQIKAIAEIRQQGDHFVKHRDQIIGRDGLIKMIDDIFYCIAQFDEPSYNQFRKSIQERSPIAFGLLAKMEANVLNEPQERSTEVSLDSNQQDN